ncbi:hypothetical protein MSAN_00615300 [Mycena sanguinolenta]|uniref:Uncharacterized protein n=1 Tax=Mycena sanguinolenta TaxID=230812 RepID=A0A8H6Z0D6_9AGAR|nr:hypothetical protein MSAN_00615300 [Mycena sanguinolenta]
MKLTQAAIFLHWIFFANVYGASGPDLTTGTDGKHLVAFPHKETNADRFRRGLGPLPPTRREHNNLNPHASTVPCTRLSSNIGTLQIRRLSDGEKIGYLSQKYNREKAYTVHPRPKAALNVVVPPLAPFGMAIDLIASNAPDSGNLFLGAVDDGEGNLGAGEAGVAMLSGTTGIQGNSPPSSNAGTSLTLMGRGGSESQIWTMNCQTRQITAQWTNADGSQPRTTIFYDPAPKRQDSFLGLTGDLQAFNAAVSEDAYEVTMTFVPNSE